jgi:hypothetical protein
MGLRDLFKKKLTPGELRTKLAMANKRLEKRERTLVDKRDRARGNAREALKNGDERGFRLASKRFALVNGQIQAISGMVEMAAIMLDIVEMQTSLSEIVEIGGMLKDYQDKLGINTKQMEKMLKNLQVSMDKVDSAAEMINTSMEVATAGDITTSEAQDQLKSELMAEIEAEKVGGSSLEDKIAAERKKL